MNMKKRSSKFATLFATGLLAAALGGCGGTSNSFVATNTNNGGGGGAEAFVITEPDVLALNGDEVDTIELQAFDAEGNLLTYSDVSAQTTDGDSNRVLRPFSPSMSFPPLPQGTESVEVDYLRNEGFALYRATEDVSAGQRLLSNPSQQQAGASSSKWELEKDAGGNFQLKLTRTVAGKTTVEPEFKIKGICYSPTPINVLGDGAPNIGDFFFDPVKNAQGQTVFFNWYALWGFGNLGDGFFARDDLNTIRGLNANTIRTYSMLSRQQNDIDTNPQLPEFPPPQGQYHHQHKDFLDKCWNNGVNPLYVIVGIPTPADVLYLPLQSNPPAKREFYSFVLRETIADLKDHPAVLGFTTQNELNDGRDAFPGDNPNGTGQMPVNRTDLAVVNARSDFYWGKLKEHSDYAKATAPDKLNGAVFHDFREVAQYAAAVPTTGGTYLERASGLDFVGINTYQTVNYQDQYTEGWGAVQGDGRKAMLFSELGFPATTRDGTDPTTIKDTAASRAATATKIGEMLPQAYQNGVSLGACYFEFSDEWWKEPTDTKQVIVNGNPKTVRAVERQVGGTSNDGFPNKWNDEEGFGLFSIARYPGLQNTDPVLVRVDGNDIGPDRRVDKLTERTEITRKVREIFKAL